MLRRLGILILLLLVAAPSLAEVSPRTALLLFIGGRPHDGVPVPVAELRRFATARARGLLAAEGHDLVDTADFDPVRRAWRIRSSGKLDPGFLRECAEQAGADNLVVIELLSRTDHMLAMARLVTCPDGVLADLAVKERPAPAADAPPADPPTWQQDVSALLEDLLPGLGRSPATPSGDIVAVMPLDAVGTTPDLDLAALHVQLESILATGTVQVLEPAVVASVLLDAGLEPNWIGDDARRELERAFGVRTALVPSLISYETARRTTRAVVIDDTAVPPLSVRDFVLGLRAVDLRRGHLLAESQVYADVSQNTGWFGRQPEITLLGTLGQAAHELQRHFLKDLEED